MKEIKKRLASGVCECELPGKRPYKNFGGVPLHPTAGKNCTSCGVCAGECPVGAISLEDPRATAKDMCISCMRCVAICPMQARRPNPVVHETVTLALRAACAKRKDNQWF